mmetsp:Transcript_3738/g.4309  ORF Transcript_3738/g.4309 Transcript_3738/m.4309 type:complete len:103 (-) Transcript_3738:114-422(-)
MCNDLGEASHCCVYYSGVGAIFTFWCVLMFHFQPFYIAGLGEDIETAKSSATGACYAFAGLFLLSAIGIIYDSRSLKEPITEDPTEGYQLSKGDVPNYGTST